MGRALVWFSIIAGVLVAGTFGIGEILSAPVRHRVGSPPVELAAESIVLPVSSSETVTGWWAPGRPSRGVVLLLHGVRGDRRQMANRAKLLHAAGHGVFLIDLPAHGESDGARITFGYRESHGYRVALRFLREKAPGERIGVIGVSLGGASIVLADDTPPPDAVVLESVYPTLVEAVANRLRMRFGGLGAELAPLLLRQLPIRVGISADQLRPIDRIASLRAPLLIASGTADRQTTLGETLRLYAAAAEPKELWLVDGAAHVDLQAFDPAAYERHVFAFLASRLRTSNTP